MKTNQQMKTPLLTGTSVAAKRGELKAYFRNAWATYESLFALISHDDAYYLRPEPLRHPLIFYYGHTAVFYINKLLLGKYIDKRLNKKLEAICAVGVDEMSWDDLNSEHYDWPTVDEVRQYRRQVATLVEQLIDEMPLQLPITQDSLAWVILMGCEHERIHIETSSVIMRMLPLCYLQAHQDWPSCPYVGAAPLNQLLDVPGRTQHLGKASDDHTYGWDNEYGELSVEVADFRAGKYLVSNQEFLAFVEAGGYQTPEYWSHEGQQWLGYSQARMPRFWLHRGGQYYQRNLLDEIALPLNWPVEVNYLEAKAFCNWLSVNCGKHIRLPTESEWYCLRDNLGSDLISWSEAPGNINLEYFASSCPVDRFECQGFYDIIGNVWQWTESAIDGFNGFQVHPLYDDFSTPTFDGRHNLFKGGSWISTGNEAIKASRYAFRRHFFQHAGFRYIESDSAEVPVVPMNRYETDVDVCRELHCHYGESPLTTANYPQQLAQRVLQLVEKYRAGRNKLLDLGCSVGRCTFELAPYFAALDGVDFSARFIQHGVHCQSGQPLRYELASEGELLDYFEISLKELQLARVDNILFSQGDACNLKEIFTGYDVILAQQVLEHCYDPALFLRAVAGRLTASGLLILLSDYRFDESISDRQRWLGGRKINGENVTGLDAVAELLQPDFTLLEQQDIDKVQVLDSRHATVSRLQLSVWQRNY